MFKVVVKILWTIFIVGVIGAGLVLMLIGFNIKYVATIYSSVIDGKNNLEQSLTQAQSGHFSEAKNSATEAANEFNEAKIAASNFRLGPLSYIKIIKSYKTDVESLVSAGKDLSEAMAAANFYGQGFESVINSEQNNSFSKLSIGERRRILEAIYNADKSLKTIDSKLSSGLNNLNKISSFSWFGPLSVKLEELKEKISSSQKTLEEASPLTRLLPPLLGYPNTARYLLILQNSDELRPTGGFVGTYGIVQTKDGDFERFETHDIYHLDMPVKDKIKIEPPKELKKYLGVNQWYMRDANWSPDWPTSAQKLEWFYKQENAALPKPDEISSFDGVIAVTPELITELMKLTGTITVDKENYTPENFVDLLQYKVEKEYIQLGTPSWQRKEVIGEIARIMKERLLDLPLSQWPQMIKLISDNVSRKNILLYSNNPDIQKMIIENGWGGEIRHDWGDYLMVVDANMAALKTDAVIDRHISYSVQEEKDKLVANLSLRYSHSGHFDWKTTRYRTYTRVYVPQGSRLVKATGFTEGDVSTGEEFGKTYFGGFLSVEPGQIGELSFAYELPQTILVNMQKYKNYRLIIQKQPGRQVNKLAVDLGFRNDIKSYSPANFYSTAADKSRLTATGDLKVDRSFFLEF